MARPLVNASFAAVSRAWLWAAGSVSAVAMGRALVRLHRAAGMPLDRGDFTHPSVKVRLAALGLDPDATIAAVPETVPGPAPAPA